MESRTTRFHYALLVALVFLPCGCAWWKESGKPLVRGIDDAAKKMCSVFYSEQNSISLDDAARIFCKTREAWAPWIDPALRAQAEGDLAALGQPAAIPAEPCNEPLPASSARLPSPAYLPTEPVESSAASQPEATASQPEAK